MTSTSGMMGDHAFEDTYPSPLAVRDAKRLILYTCHQAAIRTFQAGQHPEMRRS